MAGRSVFRRSQAVAGRRRVACVVLLAVAAFGASTFVSGPAKCRAPRLSTVAMRGEAEKAPEGKKTLEQCKEEDMNPMQKVKELGIAGTIAFALWEAAFWIIGGAGAAAFYVYQMGHLPDFSNQEELAAVGGEAFVFINGARLALPLRIGLVVASAPWVDENIVKKYIEKPDDECEVLYEEEGKKGETAKAKVKETVDA